jgi:hypothetical protein
LDIPTTVMIDAGTMDQNGGRRFSIPIGREFPPDIPRRFLVAAMTPEGLALGAPVGVLMRNYQRTAWMEVGLARFGDPLAGDGARRCQPD